MKQKRISPARLIAVGFLSVIAAGTLLLMLPVCHTGRTRISFVDALFTAVSAVCVTGLNTLDPGLDFSTAGHAVIVLLIQIGGLGITSLGAGLVALFGGKLNQRENNLVKEALNYPTFKDVMPLIRAVLTLTFVTELLGAAMAFCTFVREYPLGKAVWISVFHSVASFNNAGFDIFGCLQPGSSLQLFQSDPVVLLTLGLLIVVSGLGFFVWEEVIRLRQWKKLSVYTKLVLLMSVCLIIGGMAGFCILEWNNPATMGNMPWYDKLLNGFFQSVSTRTAGFDALGQGGLTESGKALTIMLMFVGGSSGSTAGGVKTVTVMVLFLFLWSRIRRKGSVCVFGRSVPDNQVMDAMTIVSIVAALALFGGLFISATSPVGFTDSLYESVSALATVGLTTGATASLSIPAQILIIIYMYFGRVGVLTLSLGFLMGNQAQERFRYAHTNLLIG